MGEYTPDKSGGALHSIKLVGNMIELNSLKANEGDTHEMIAAKREKLRQCQDWGEQGRGIRGEIDGTWSNPSRHKFLKKLCRIDTRNRIAHGLTFTIPGKQFYDVWSQYPDHKKAMEMKTWMKRANQWSANQNKLYPGLNMCCYWKLEPQERGAPHWHLLVLDLHEWAMLKFPEYAESFDPEHPDRHRKARELIIHNYLSPLWQGWVLKPIAKGIAPIVIDEKSKSDHLKRGLRVVEMTPGTNWAQYMSKYLAKKHDKDGNEIKMITGVRFWGSFNKKLIPEFDDKDYRLASEGYVHFMRMARKLRKSQAKSALLRTLEEMELSERSLESWPVRRLPKIRRHLNNRLRISPVAIYGSNRTLKDIVDWVTIEKGFGMIDQLDIDTPF